MHINNIAYSEKHRLADDFQEVFRICEGFLRIDINLEKVAKMTISAVKSPSQKLLAQRLIDNRENGKLFEPSLLMPEFPLDNAILHRTGHLLSRGQALKGIRLASKLLSISLINGLSEKEKFVHRLVAFEQNGSYVDIPWLCETLAGIYVYEGKTEEAEAFGRIARNLGRGHSLTVAMNFWLPSYVNMLLQEAESKGQAAEAFEALLELGVSLEVD